MTAIERFGYNLSSRTVMIFVSMPCVGNGEYNGAHTQCVYLVDILISTINRIFHFLSLLCREYRKTKNEQLFIISLFCPYYEGQWAYTEDGF